MAFILHLLTITYKPSKTWLLWIEYWILWLSDWSQNYESI